MLNIASHFLSAIDIGPELYTVYKSFESLSKSGRTKLHMDMASAVNIMLLATPMPDNKLGCAVWDLYWAHR